MSAVRTGFRKMVTCRRSVIALTGLAACFGITLVTGIDTSGSIALIVTSVAGANAAQAVFSPPPKGSDDATS